jgi:outer membrane immunogenic protein
MRIDKVFLPAIIILAMSVSASAQNVPAQRLGTDESHVPAIEVGVNYTFMHANAPPASCGCFSMNGGSGTFVVNTPRGISYVADLSAAHASQVDGTNQNITIFNYLFGPRYSYRAMHRFTPYVEVLAGGSKETSNYTYVADVSAFAASGGGGISTVLNRRFAWNIFEADYVYSRLPNAVNTHQNNLRITSGITFRFGQH